jgi:hypothetical protein
VLDIETIAAELRKIKMGTRNLTCVVLDGEFKVAQYGQWDGYPSGQGSTILDFLRADLDENTLKSKVRALTGIKSDILHKQVHDAIEKALAEASEEDRADARKYLAIENAAASEISDKYSTWDRNIGADILLMIQEHTSPMTVVLDTEFASDSLFCEWCYVVDLDKRTFEVYSGFNSTRLQLSETERFSFLNSVVKDRIEGTGRKRSVSTTAYGPVVFVKSYSFDDLPTKEQFIKECEKSEDEDGE